MCLGRATRTFSRASGSLETHICGLLSTRWVGIYNLEQGVHILMDVAHPYTCYVQNPRSDNVGPHIVLPHYSRFSQRFHYATIAQAR